MQRKYIHYILGLVAIVLLLAPACSESQPAQQDTQAPTFDLLYTNDMHGQLLPDAERQLGGIATIASLVAEIRQDSSDVLLLDAGDIWQGAARSNENGGDLMIQAMNQMGYDAWTLGNHEFDQGIPNLQQRIASSQASVLGANVYRGEQHWSAVQDHIIQEIGGVQVGIFGLAYPYTPDLYVQSNLGAIQLREPEAIARQQVQSLQDAGVDLIIALSHLGETGDINLAQAVDGIDIIVGGHSHHKTEDPPLESNGALILAAGAFTEYLGHAQITIQPDGELKLENELLRVADTGMAPDAAIEQLIEERWQAIQPEQEARIGVAAAPFNTQAVCNLVADAMRTPRAGVAAPDIAVMNRGGVVHTSIPAGDIMRHQIEGLFPYPNQLTYLQVSGEQLQRILTQSQGHLCVSGLLFTYAEDTGATDVVIGDTRLDPAATYRVATIKYLAEGGGNWHSITEAIGTQDREDDGTMLPDVLADYVKQQSPVVPDDSRRIGKTDEPIVADLPEPARTYNPGEPDADSEEPATASDEDTGWREYTHELLSFSYPTSLANDIRAETIPEITSAPVLLMQTYPEHTRFFFDGYPISKENLGWNIWDQPQIALFRVAEYAEAAEQVAQLQTLLQAPPDSDAYTNRMFPFVPVVGIPPYMATRANILDFENGSGISYLGQFTSQGGLPIDEEIFYTFQGITNDGAWYVSVTFPVVAANLPTLDDPAMVYQYNDEIIRLLNERANSEFRPDLMPMDAIVQSLFIGGSAETHMVFVDSGPSGDTSPILVPQFGPTDSKWATFAWISPDPAPDATDLGLYLRKDPAGISSPLPRAADLPSELAHLEGKGSYFYHPSWQVSDPDEADGFFRVGNCAEDGIVDGNPTYRCTFKMHGNGCAVSTCPDSQPERIDLNTGQPLPTEYYREDLGIYNTASNAWMTALPGQGANPEGFANAWFSIKLIPDAIGGDVAYLHEGNIWLLNLLTNETRQLTDLPSDRTPERLAWSPDGQWLFFAAVKGSIRKSDVYKLNVDDPDTEPTSVMESEWNVTDAEVLPDGSFFVSEFMTAHNPVKTTPSYNSALLKLDATGRRTDSWRDGIAMISCAPMDISLSADSRRMAINSSCANNAFTMYDMVFLLDLETDTSMTLRDTVGWVEKTTWANTQPVLAVLGQSMSDAVAKMEPPALHLVSFETAPPQSELLFETETRILNMDWSPDDQWLVFEQAQQGLWIINPKNGELRQISEVGTAPAWRLEGAAMAAESGDAAELSEAIVGRWVLVGGATWPVGAEEERQYEELDRAVIAPGTAYDIAFYPDGTVERTSGVMDGTSGRYEITDESQLMLCATDGSDCSTTSELVISGDEMIWRSEWTNRQAFGEVCPDFDGCPDAPTPMVEETTYIEEYVFKRLVEQAP